MSEFKSLQLNDEELTSPSSDEKMDTGSESFRSQDTPNSVLSSEFDGDHPEPVLRLQNPDVRRSEPKQLNDSLLTKMSNLRIDSPKVAPRSLGISPPKYNSILTLTTSHPLMSPDENYPDLIPKKIHKIEDEKEISISSMEDEKIAENNEFYKPERNTSKNNLYFSDAFVTAESQDLDLMVTPDVARVDKVMRRKIVAKLKDTPEKAEEMKFVKGNLGHSTPVSRPVDICVNEEFTGVAEWCESPSHLRAMPNFELPIEMSSSLGIHNDLDSPDLISASTQEDRSAYQALLDPYTGSVALRHTSAPQRSPGTKRRKIQLPPEVEDSCSLDSVSACSMESEEEPPEPNPELIVPSHPVPLPRDLLENSISKSSNTVSECSDPIPEYSAAEELSNERGWISVQRGNEHATCDMKVIEPYKRVISHGGYDSRGAAIIVFSACHLPDCARPDYTYVMDNLFLYVIWTLERLVTDEYVLIYLHGSAGSRKLPSFHWLHECYKLIDRRLRKSLKHLYLVHPTFWVKAFVTFTKPFVSSKFVRKLSFVRSLAELAQKVPVEPNAIPEMVKQFDATRR